jgi:short-subunit dehydrogenase
MKMANKAFNGKVIWITGASSGIGESLVNALAGSGARLIISARRVSELERVRDSWPSESREDVRILPFDLKDTNLLESVTREALEIFGSIDILVLNGGIAQRGLAMYTKIEVDRELMEIDYFSCVALSKYLLPHFQSRGTGQFVVVSSVMGLIGTPFRSGYAAAKHALHGYFESLRAEMWKKYRGVKVTIICPGWVKTNITYNAVAGDGSKLNSMDKATAHGMDPAVFARKMLKAIARQEFQVVIGGAKESFAAWLMRHFPNLYARLIPRFNTR